MKSHSDKINRALQNSIAVKQHIMKDSLLTRALDQTVREMILAYQSDHKVLFCGNGGSAADAQHLAAELSGRYYFDRKPLYAEALHVNTSHVTAVGNDYSFEEIFSRLVEAKGRPGDVLIAISTSGNSPNIIKAVETANATRMVTVGMTGSTGGRMKALCKYLLNVPSTDTPRIQEAHILMGHILCELVEDELFGPVNK
jgi:D-sedoheptulose 7-phosphate isomerase